MQRVSYAAATFSFYGRDISSRIPLVVVVVVVVIVVVFGHSARLHLQLYIT